MCASKPCATHFLRYEADISAVAERTILLTENTHGFSSLVTFSYIRTSLAVSSPKFHNEMGFVLLCGIHLVCSVILHAI